MTGETQYAHVVNIMAAAEPETDSMADLASSSVPGIASMMQKQIAASVDNNQLNKNFLGSRYMEDVLEQRSQKEIARISRIGEKHQLVQKKKKITICVGKKEDLTNYSHIYEQKKKV